MRLALGALQRSSSASLFTYGCAAHAFQQFCTAHVKVNWTLGEWWSATKVLLQP